MRYATSTTTRPADDSRTRPSAADNLDRLLGLLEQARSEQAAHSQSVQPDPYAPYRKLLEAVKAA